MTRTAQPWTRRTFVASAALSATQLARGQQRRSPSYRYPRSPHERLAVATYPFRARIIAPHNSDRSEKVPGMDLAGFARYIRTEFDVFGIEPLHSHFPSTEPAEVRKLKAAFDAEGVRTVNIPVDEDVDLTSPDVRQRETGYRTLERWIDIAVLLNAPSIRIGAVPHGAGAADISGAAAAFEPLLRYASAHNVMLCLENDDPVFGNAARVTAILERVNSPWLRALPDFANSLMGGDEQFNADAVRSMFRFAASIAHVKDAEVIDNVRRTVSLQKLFGIARQADFRGFYSMESDSDVDPTADTKHLIERCLPLM